MPALDSIAAICPVRRERSNMSCIIASRNFVIGDENGDHGPGEQDLIGPAAGKPDHGQGRVRF
jgi:hypothetical protein